MAERLRGAPHQGERRVSVATQRNDATSIIKLIYDGYNSTLSYDINDKSCGVAYNTYKGEGFSYRLAIYLKMKAKIELVSMTTKCVV